MGLLMWDVGNVKVVSVGKPRSLATSNGVKYLNFNVLKTANFSSSEVIFDRS